MLSDQDDVDLFSDPCVGPSANQMAEIFLIEGLAYDL